MSNIQLESIDMNVLSTTANNNAKVSPKTQPNAANPVMLELTKLLFLKNTLQTTNV